MSKRFTDNEKWKKQWFRKLPDNMKLLWIYICDNCNIAGIWDVDLELASFLIGSQIDEKFALSAMEKQIMVLSPSKWIIKDFVNFQYGDLIPNNNMHKAVIRVLESSGASQGLVRGYLAPMDKDKVKDKVKDTVKEGIVKGNQKNLFLSSVYLTTEEHSKLIERFGDEGVKQRIYDLNNGIMSKGYKYKSHYHTILSWERRHERLAK